MNTRVLHTLSLQQKIVLFIVVMACACLFMGSRADAKIILTDTNNVVPNTAMVDNWDFDSTQPFGVRKIGDKGYLVVGSGAFDNGMFAITYETATNAAFNITIEHAAICNAGNPYGYYQGVDYPDNGTTPTTYFWGLPADFNSINERSEVAVGRDCGTLNRTLTIGTAQLTRLPNGKYGGVLIAALLSGGAGSQQNSFRLIGPAGTVLGYSSETVALATNSLTGLPPAEKTIMNTFFPDWTSINTSYRTSINLANTALPGDGFSQMYLNFVLDYCSPVIPAGGVKVRFYDADDSTNGGVLQGTATRPELRLVVQRRPRDNLTAWPTEILNYRLIGGNHQFEYVNMPAMNDQYYYTATVVGLSQPNALQFSIDVGAYGMANRIDPSCSYPPIPDCIAMSAPASVVAGTQFSIVVTLRNNYYQAAPGGATLTDGYHLGVTNTSGQNPPDDPNPNANAPNGQWYPLNSGTNLANEYTIPFAGGAITRMPIATGIPANGQTAYRIFLTAPNRAVDNKYLGVRVLDRTNAAWDPQAAVCDTTINIVDTFNVTAQPRPPVLDDSELPTSINAASLIDFSGSATTVLNVATDRSYAVYRAGTYDAATGTITSASAPVPIGNTTSANVTVNDKPTDNNALGIQTVAIPSAIGSSLRAGDYICLTLRISPPSGTVDSAGNIVTRAAGSSTRTQCTAVLGKPYMRVYGSDIMAGMGFGTNCNPPNTNVIGFAKQLTATTATVAADANKWVGSGTQMGVFANGTVTGFASTSMLSPLTPSARVFSNTGATTLMFGGNYGSKICDDDYWATKSTTLTASNGAIPSLHSLSSGQYQYSAGSVLSSATQDIRNRIAIYVDGDITITTNITLALTGVNGNNGSPRPWTSVNELPSFYLVARGNIYVAPNVTRLDGVYIAMPRVPSVSLATPAGGGRIFTCTDNGASPSTAVLAGACSTNRLTINGMLSATRVNFLRTGGELRNVKAPAEASGSTNIAETINFLPELLLGIPAPAVLTSGQYDSVISLPPAL